MKVIITRPEGADGGLSAALEARGHEVARWPLIAIEPIGNEPVDVSGYDWVVITSANGARELRRRMHGTPARVAAIGPATAAAFGPVDLVAEVSTQEGLLDELPRPAGRVLFAGAEGARRLLADELGADFLALYRTVPLRPDPAPQGDVAIVASPSAARALAALAVGTPVVSMGPETSRAAREAGLDVVAEAEFQSVAGIADAVERVRLPR